MIAISAHGLASPQMQLKKYLPESTAMVLEHIKKPQKESIHTWVKKQHQQAETHNTEISPDTWLTPSKKLYLPISLENSQPTPLVGCDMCLLCMTIQLM